MSLFQGYEQQPLVSLERAIQPLISIVPGIEQMVEVAKENTEESSANHLSSDESASIILYTSKWKTSRSSFRFILNKTLRSQIREELLPWFLYLRLFINALSKLPSIPVHTVFRRMTINETEEYSEGKKFIWWDLVSCTLKPDFNQDSSDENETKVIFSIECDFAKNISEYSPDNEILLYPARQFRVISVSNYGDQLKFIHLQEIRQDHPLIQISQISSNTVHPTQAFENVIDQSLPTSKVDLTKQKLTDANMNYIVNNTIINKPCQKLLLSRNMITSNGTLTIATALNNNNTLEFLSLSYNNLSDEGVKFLTKVLTRNNCKLTTLSLHKTGITDESAQHLSRMLEKNTTLTWLHLGRNKISDQGIQLLADALAHHNKTLKVLDLSHNRLITDSSVESLVEMLKENESLETLWINNCSLSAVAKKELEKTVKSNKRFFLLFVKDLVLPVDNIK